MWKNIEMYTPNSCELGQLAWLQHIKDKKLPMNVFFFHLGIHGSIHSGPIKFFVPEPLSLACLFCGMELLFLVLTNNYR